VGEVDGDEPEENDSCEDEEDFVIMQSSPLSAPLVSSRLLVSLGT